MFNTSLVNDKAIITTLTILCIIATPSANIYISVQRCIRTTHNDEIAPVKRFIAD